MARYLTERDKLIRDRLPRFMAAAGVQDVISVPALDKAICERRSRRGNGCGALYGILKGARTARPDMAFEIGEALRQCGVAWSSGPLALYAAGYLADFFGAIFIAAGTGKDRLPEAAIALAFAALRACALDVDGVTAVTATEARKAGRKSHENNARDICAAAVERDAGSSFDVAYKTWQTASNRGDLKKAIPDASLRAALQYAESTTFSFAERERSALGMLDFWVRNGSRFGSAPASEKDRRAFDERDKRIRHVGQTLRWFSPIRENDTMPSDHAIQSVMRDLRRDKQN